MGEGGGKERERERKRMRKRGVQVDLSIRWRRNLNWWTKKKGGGGASKLEASTLNKGKADRMFSTAYCTKQIESRWGRNLS